MAEIILSVSVLLQFTAAALAFRLAWSLRGHAWSFVALAIFLMGLRRSLTLHAALALGRPIDVGAETVALVISCLMLLGVWGVGRRAGPPQEKFWYAAPSRRRSPRLNRTAALFGTLTILGSTAIGVMAYSASHRAALEHSFEINLNLANALASLADRFPHEDDDLLYGALETLWEEIRPPASRRADREGKASGGSYFCIVRADGTLAAHSSRPDAVGTSVRERPLGYPPEPGAKTLGQLAAADTPWVGRYVASDGEVQVVAFVPTTALGGLVAVHVPLAAIEAEFHDKTLPYVAGLALITFGLLPLSLLLLYRAFLSSQDRLRESEQRMKLALEGTSDGLWDWDLAAGTVEYDDNWKRILGFELEEQEFDFAWWGENVHPESKPIFEQALAAYLEGRERYYELEYRIRTKSGEWKWVWARGLCVAYGVNGEPLRMIGTHRDVTREKALEEQLRQAQKMEAIGQLAGGVAHDFNNLLQVILSHTELASDQVSASSPAGKSLAEIDRAAERAAELTRRLLAFSRRQVLQPVELDLHQMLVDLARMLRRILGEDVDLRVPDASDAGLVRADRGQIEEVVMNLCVNARDAMKGGGILTLEVSGARFDEAFCHEHPWARPGDFVALSVSDTGCGMTEDVLGRVFEPFFTTKGVGQGTGLGLSMVSGTVEQHQGWIRVESEPGHGTTFHLYFPRIEPEDVEKAKPAAPFPRGGTETILLVEDEERVRQITALLLEEAGYRVLLARHGAEAVELVEDHLGNVALVVLDVIMPEMGGVEARDEIRKLDPDVRFLFHTGYSATVLPKQAGRHDAVLTKPYSRDTLLRTVREVLDG